MISRFCLVGLALNTSRDDCSSALVPSGGFVWVCLSLVLDACDDLVPCFDFVLLWFPAAVLLFTLPALAIPAAYIAWLWKSSSRYCVALEVQQPFWLRALSQVPLPVSTLAACSAGLQRRCLACLLEVTQWALFAGLITSAALMVLGQARRTLGLAGQLLPHAATLLFDAFNHPTELLMKRFA